MGFETTTRSQEQILSGTVVGRSFVCRSPEVVVEVVVAGGFWGDRDARSGTLSREAGRLTPPLSGNRSNSLRAEKAPTPPGSQAVPENTHGDMVVVPERGSVSAPPRLTLSPGQEGVAWLFSPACVSSRVSSCPPCDIGSFMLVTRAGQVER